MVGILDALDRRGVIRRTASKEDRRKHLIVPTPKAAKHLPKIKKIIAELNRKAMAGLPENLAAHFGTALSGMKAELEKVILNAKDQESESDAPRPGRKPRKEAA